MSSNFFEDAQQYMEKVVFRPREVLLIALVLTPPPRVSMLSHCKYGCAEGLLSEKEMTLKGLMF